MDSTSAAGATPPPSAPVSYPVFAAVAVAITGRGVYDVIEQVGQIFESAGAVFEGSPDAPGTLLALLPPSDAAALQAVQLGLRAQAAAPAVRLGVDATEVHTKQEQDAKWQQVIDSVLHLQKAARSGEAIAGTGIDQLTHGAAAATEALQVGEHTYLLLTGVRDLASVPDQGAVVETTTMEAPLAAEPEPVEASAPQPATSASEPEVEMAEQVDAAPPPAPVEPELLEPELVEPEPVEEPVEEALTQRRVETPAEEAPVVHVAPTPEVTPSSPSPIPTARWDGPLLGRDAQLADLRARFDRVVAERVGAGVLITGEPGSGRTRLARELADGLPDARILTVGCAPAEGGGARWPLAALVEAIADLEPLAPAEPARARLAELCAGAPDAEMLVPQLAAMLALEGTSEPDRIAWALRRLLEVALVPSPTLVIVDDADRSGAGFVRLLADVAAGLRDVSVLFVITTTRESDGLPAVRLGPLTTEHAAQLVAALLGPVEDGLDSAIAARVHGTPLAIEQALALLTESGTIAPGQGRWRPLADLARVPLPDTTIGTVRQRLQTLPPHELVVLGMAAVAGERFETSSVLDTVPDDARAGVPAALDDLAARGYLTGASDVYGFRHPLLREATIPGVPDWAQAAAHATVGRHLERRAGERVHRIAEEIGAHLESGWRLRPDGAEHDRTDALALLLWSAAAAAAQGDLDGAARIERLAATLVDGEPARRAELLYLAADHAATAAPDRPADRELAEAALAASVAGDDVDWRVRLLRARLRTTAGHDDALEGARATADEAIAAFGDDERSWALSCAWALRGMVHAARAQNGMVAEDLQHAADNAAAADRPTEETAALRGVAAALLDGPVHVDEAEARCLSFLERVRGPLAEHDVRTTIAVLRARHGAFDQARHEAAASIAALEELGAAVDLAIALHRASEIEVLASQPHAAEPQMQRALAAAAHARDDALRAHLAASFAHVLAEDGERLDEALALADVAEAHAGDVTTHVRWRMARARVMVRRSRGAQAERLVREGLSIAEQTDSTDLRASALRWAADVRRTAGRPAEAEPFERRALRLFERRGATAQAAAIAAALTPPLDPAPAPTSPPTPPTEPEPTPASHAVDDETPPPAPSAASRLADEMMAMFAGSDQPTATEPGVAPAPRPTPELDPVPAGEPTDDSFASSAERPSAEIDPADELLNDPMRSAQEESHRRWFNR